MQLMISDITASYSGSYELNRILNQLGITVGRKTLNRYITAVFNPISTGLFYLVVALGGVP